MSAVPIRYARGNLLLGPAGEPAALYRLPTVSYALAPDEEKWAWLWTLAGLAFNAKADLSIYRVARQWPAAGYVAQAAGLVDERFQDPVAWRRFLEGHTPHIEQLNSYLPEVYLRVAMTPPSSSRAHGRLRALDRGFRRVSDAFGVGTDAPISESEITGLIGQESLMLDRVRRSLNGARRATTRELQWLCRRAAVRHVAEPVLDPNWQPNAMVVHSPAGGLQFVPRRSDFLRMFNAVIERDDNHLVVRGDEARTYQAFLTLGTMPEEVEFPGAQAEMLFRPLEALDFPVDAALHCKWIANRKALAEVDKAIIDAENAVTEATAGAHGPDDSKLLSPEVGRALKTYLQSDSRPPMLEGSISFAVGASTEAELIRRVEALADQFTGVVLHRPAGLQEHLYYDHLVRPAGGQVTDYDEMLTLEQFGMLMPIATREVGTERGPYIGHTIVNGRACNPVKQDLTAPAQDALPTSIYMAGRQGSGKTNGALITAFVSGAMRGSYVLTADPGPDHFITRMPELQGQASIIGLVADARYRGMLDPLVVTPEDLREEIALSYYLDVLPDSRAKGDWETELTEAVKHVMTAGGGSLAVLEHLARGNDTARDVARRLTLISGSGLGVLAFGDGTNVVGFESIDRVTTITMASLELPSPDLPREQYDRRERQAVATFKLVAAYIMWLVTHDRSIHKVVVLDEAWALPTSLLDKLVRLGRKYNTTVIICSQTIGDAVGELKNLIGSWFIFGVNGPDEARRALRLLDLDPQDGGLVAKLTDKRQFAKGRCLHKDLEGRVAEMQIDAVYQHILDTLNTSPADSKEAIAV